jgi:hypothetical protein
MQLSVYVVATVVHEVACDVDGHPETKSRSAFESEQQLYVGSTANVSCAFFKAH